MQLGLGLTLGAQGSGTPPAPSVPVISSVTIDGTPTVGIPVGVIVSCTGYPPPTYTYAWKLDGTPIGGATGATYTPVEADIGAEITCTVTAINSEGLDSATSNAIAVSVPSGGWVLETGAWDDDGVWDDTANWKDAA